MAQDDYYYEIQLTNKQLVFYFMAGATGLILSFLAGVMVGRGVDTGGEVQAARSVHEDRVIAEEPPRATVPPPAEDLTYAQRLEGEKADDTLEKPKTSTPARPPAVTPVGKPTVALPATQARAPLATPAASPLVTQSAVPRPAPAVEKPAAGPPPSVPRETAAAKEAAAPGSFTIQVGAFKDRGSAESVVGRLKKKGFAAFVASAAGTDGLFNVRVGSYAARADAERAQTRLRDEEKFKPFIVKQ